MMLAMLPPSVPHHDGQHHVPVMSSSTVTFSQPSVPAGSSQMRQSRPRLTLNTTLNASKPRTFGKGSSLSLNTLSAVSPTVKNTFVNAYQPIPETTTTLRPKLLIDPSVGQAEDFGTPSDQDSSRTPSNSSISSASTASSEHQRKLLYSQPEGITSILLTSVAHRSYNVRMSNEARPDMGSKRVSFRDPLVEEIRTLKYILAHSDIESVESSLQIESSDSSDTTPTTTSLPEPSSTDKTEQPTFDFQVPTAPSSDADMSSSPPTKKSLRGSLRTVPRRKSSPVAPTRMKRDSSSDEDSDDAEPQTPIAGRCKKRRQWAWTLDPLPGQKDNEGVEKAGGSVASNDDDSVSTGSRFSESSTN